MPGFKMLCKNLVEAKNHADETTALGMIFEQMLIHAVPIKPQKEPTPLNKKSPIIKGVR